MTYTLWTHCIRVVTRLHHYGTGLWVVLVKISSLRTHIFGALRATRVIRELGAATVFRPHLDNIPPAVSGTTICCRRAAFVHVHTGARIRRTGRRPSRLARARPYDNCRIAGPGVYAAHVLHRTVFPVYKIYGAIVGLAALNECLHALCRIPVLYCATRITPCRTAARLALALGLTFGLGLWLALALGPRLAVWFTFTLGPRLAVRLALALGPGLWPGLGL